MFLDKTLIGSLGSLTFYPSVNVYSGGNIGKRTNFYVDGALDDTRIYDRALTLAEITAHYDGDSIDNTDLALRLNYEHSLNDDSGLSMVVSLFNHSEVYEVFSRDSFRCKACGRGADDGVKLTVDHVVPVDWCGTSDISNLVALCEECNRGKKAWIDSVPSQSMKDIMYKQTIEQRIEEI